MQEQKRGIKGFFIDVARKPPLVMPFVGIAHVLWLLWVLWQCRVSPIGSIEWLQVLWLAAYSISWIAACDLRKWGALSYMVLALINTSLFLLVKNVNDRELYMSNLFILDAIFSFYLLFFYKRFS
jgi:hypothetical protein